MIAKGEVQVVSEVKPRLWPYWIAALALAFTEWVLPLRYGRSGGLTVLSFLFSFVWLTRMAQLLFRAEAVARRIPVVRSWSMAGLVLVWVLYATAQAAKWALLREWDLDRPPESLLPAYRSFVMVGFVLSGLALSFRPRPLQRLLLAAADHTARLVALSFLGTILIGAFLLLLPVSVRNPSDISVINALFMSASAVCVTGLAVVPPAQTYSFFGQLVLLGLVQIGGLGIMVMYGAVVALAGRRMSTRSARMMSEVIDVASLSAVRRLVWGIVVFTFVVEGLGALGLHFSLRLFPEVAMGPAAELPLAGAGNLVWASVFLSVSAYCNAGFALFRDGMVPLSGNWAVSGIVMSLVVIGGLGFPVSFELLGRFWNWIRRRRSERMSLHCRTVLVVTAVLLLLGTVMFLTLEWTRSMDGLPLHAKVLTAAFQSVVTRTAGFNSLDFSKMAAATWLGTCVLMFIGASPGSTGGGIKTTTFAVLIAATSADLRARSRIELGRRSVADGAARRAVGVTLISGGIVILITFLLMLSETFEPLKLGFEAVSALATVGLSTGITPDLTPLGKLTITTAMYLGRIGPLTLAMAMAATPRPCAITLPEERLGIG